MSLKNRMTPFYRNYTEAGEAIASELPDASFLFR